MKEISLPKNKGTLIAPDSKAVIIEQIFGGPVGSALLKEFRKLPDKDKREILAVLGGGISGGAITLSAVGFGIGAGIAALVLVAHNKFRKGELSLRNREKTIIKKIANIKKDSSIQLTGGECDILINLVKKLQEKAE